MNIFKPIRLVLKILFALLYISLTFASIAGLYSTASIMSSPNNIAPLTNQMQVNINPTNASMDLPIEFNNTGLFDMDAMNVSFALQMTNISSNKIFVIVNETQHEGNLHALTQYRLELSATTDAFNFSNILLDGLNSTLTSYENYTATLFLQIDSLYTFNLIHYTIALNYTIPQNLITA